MGHVYYHHPENKRFSLNFVNPDPDNIVSRIVDYDDKVAMKVRQYELDEEFYVVFGGLRDCRLGFGARFES